MARILVTGADGFTGRYMVDCLARGGHEVHGLVHRLPERAVSGLAEAHVADLGDAAAVAAVVQAVQPEQVVHLAAIAFVAHGDVEAMYRTNLLGTRHLLEALTHLSQRPAAVLLASSANIYGNSIEGSLAESTPPHPANDYAVTKLAMEHMAGLYVAKLPLIITRPFNYTGVGQSVSFLLPKIVDHVRRKAPLIELGNLQVARDFSDVRMVVDVYRRLLGQPTAVGGVFNVCSGQAYTLDQVLAMAQQIAGHQFEVRVNPAFVRQNEVRLLRGDRSRLEPCIGALESIALSDTLRWMIEA